MQESSLTAPDRRLMTVGQGLDVCYNVQTAIDNRHKLIMHHDVTNAQTDEGCLLGMATTAQEGLEVGRLEVVADKGYYAGEEIKRCEAQGILTCIPKVRVAPRLKHQVFTKSGRSRK